jgi:hypothetical protein
MLRGVEAQRELDDLPRKDARVELLVAAHRRNLRRVGVEGIEVCVAQFFTFRISHVLLELSAAVYFEKFFPCVRPADAVHREAVIALKLLDRKP